MENQIFEVIEVNKKFIKLKGIGKDIPIKNIPKGLELKKGDLIKGIYVEFSDSVTILERIDPNSLALSAIRRRKEK